MPDADEVRIVAGDLIRGDVDLQVLRLIIHPCSLPAPMGWASPQAARWAV
jgi:hypothetical protein